MFCTCNITTTKKKVILERITDFVCVYWFWLFAPYLLFLVLHAGGLTTMVCYMRLFL